MLGRLKSAWKPLSTTGALGFFTYFGVQASSTPLPGLSYPEIFTYIVNGGHWGVLVGSLMTALGGVASIRQILSAKPATAADVHRVVKPIAANVNDLSGQIYLEGEASDQSHAATQALIRADKTAQTIADIRAGAITPEKRAELVAALGLAVSAQEKTSADIAASFANATADFAQSESPVDRQAAIDILGGQAEEVADRLLADIDTVVAGQAERARRIGAILVPFNVSKAFKAYARAADLDPEHFWTWIELARLHRAIGSLADSKRCADRAAQYAADDRERSVALDELGDVAVAQRDLAAGRASFSAGLAIAERLAASDPGNSGWQRDLSVSHNKIGDVAVAQGGLAAGRASFSAGLAIRERLAASDPGNSGWQRDVFISHAKAAQHAEASGDVAGGIAAFAAAEVIIARLAGDWPDHPGFANDLANVRGDLGRLRSS